MTHDPVTHATGPHGATEDWFTPAEWEAFRSEDLRAGRFVIILMSTIFSIGIVLYGTVLFLMM